MNGGGRSSWSLRGRLSTVDASAPGDATQALLARLRRLDASTTPSWGTMSAGGMICHLTDTFRVMYGERPVARTQRRRTERSVRRSLVKVLALYLPVHWPKGLRTLSEVDQDRDGTAQGDFERDRAEVARFVERVAAGEIPNDPEHPLLGRLSAWEWRRWAYLHVDHHLRQFGQ